MLAKTIRLIDRLNEHIGHAVSWLMLILAVNTFVVVILRYVFRLSWIWLQEAPVYMHGILFMVAGGYTLLHEGHVRVDIFYQTWSPKIKAMVNILGCLFLLFPTCAVLLAYGWPYVMNSWHLLEGSRDTGGINGVYLLKTMILIFPVLLGLQGFSLTGHSLLVLMNSGKISSVDASA
ncbi:MAG: TRAP transporter small permease subunit [SAR324 cluster bacterium]|nr:TRAP transporter small permease subunit [SAR324 cluster bacterium]